MTAYTVTAVLFWVGVAAVSIAGCWLLDKISEAIAWRRERRRPYITRTPR